MAISRLEVQQTYQVYAKYDSCMKNCIGSLLSKDYPTALSPELR